MLTRKLHLFIYLRKLRLNAHNLTKLLLNALQLSRLHLNAFEL